jgi:hypothetical protein
MKDLSDRLYQWLYQQQSLQTAALVTGLSHRSRAGRPALAAPF